MEDTKKDSKKATKKPRTRAAKSSGKKVKSATKKVTAKAAAPMTLEQKLLQYVYKLRDEPWMPNVPVLIKDHLCASQGNADTYSQKWEEMCDAWKEFDWNFDDELKAALSVDDDVAFMKRVVALGAEGLMSTAQRAWSSKAYKCFAAYFAGKGAGMLPFKFLTYSANRLANDSALEFINAIEQAIPGICKSSVDACGFSLLWYALHNTDVLRYWDVGVETAPILARLIELGCDPSATSPLGVSIAEISTKLKDVHPTITEFAL